MGQDNGQNDGEKFWPLTSWLRWFVKKWYSFETEYPAHLLVGVDCNNNLNVGYQGYHIVLLSLIVEAHWFYQWKVYNVDTRRFHYNLNCY